MAAGTLALARACSTPETFSSLQPMTTQFLTPGLPVMIPDEVLCAPLTLLSVPTSMALPGPPAAV